jgi:MoxR-like ATPase
MFASAKEDTPCAYERCAYGGVIKAGDTKHWGPRYPGESFHAGCVEPNAALRDARRAAAAAGISTPAASPAISTPTPQPPPFPAAAPDADAASLIQSGIAALIRATPAGLDREAVASMIDERLAPIREEMRSAGVTRYEVTRRDGVTVDAGVQHNYFPRLLDLMTRGESIYIWGPPGTGKTQGAIEAAKALGLDYAVISMSPTSPASKLEGFLDAQGRFTNPDFYRLYTKGGVFVVDEMDNMSASAATTLNSALANGVASFPCGMVHRHQDFVFVGTGNTPGRGPTPQFPERRKLDTASLSRLRFLFWPPDLKLEVSLAVAHAGGKDAAATRWAEWVQGVREYLARPDCGIGDPVYCDMRAIIAGAREIAAPADWVTIPGLAEDVVFKGLTADKVARILAAVPLPQGVL